MIREPPSYRVLMLFGKDQPRSVADPHTLRELAVSLGDSLAACGHRIKARGVVYGPGGKNIAPRRGLITARKLVEWCDAVQKGQLLSMEIFDANWSREDYPGVYGHLVNYNYRGIHHKPENGADSCITVAVARDVPGFSEEWPEQLAQDLVVRISAFYGFIEREVQWSRILEPVPGVPSRGDPIDVRWHSIRGDYGHRTGWHSMDELVPRLYWGNILSRAHIKGGDPALIPDWALEKRESWGEDLIYLRLAKDPEFDPYAQEALAPYFSVLPGATALTR